MSPFFPLPPPLLFPSFTHIRLPNVHIMQACVTVSCTQNFVAEVHLEKFGSVGQNLHGPPKVGS